MRSRSMPSVERLALVALAPDRIALALAAVGEFEEEARLLERQWTLKRERARYEAERARRQYDAVEPENRLVARSLERAWEEHLRDVEQVEQSLRRLAPYPARTALGEPSATEVLALGAGPPQRVWRGDDRRRAQAAFCASW